MPGHRVPKLSSPDENGNPIYSSLTVRRETDTKMHPRFSSERGAVGIYPG